MTTNEPGSAGGARLDIELRSLATTLAIPEVGDQLVGAVLARLDREPVPATQSWLRRAGAALEALGVWLQNRWRTVSVALAAALLVLLAVTPAGAKVREWLGFGAVVIEQQQPAPATATAADSSPSGDPVAGRELPLDQAMAETSFPVGVPAALGDPDRVTVSADGRLVTMEWPAAAVRLDQIEGTLSPYFLKKFSDEVDYTVVDGQQALWLAQPHPILILNPDGSERAESARRSGPSLVWQNAGVTLRLEGVADQQAAVAIAETMSN